MKHFWIGPLLRWSAVDAAEKPADTPLQAAEPAGDADVAAFMRRTGYPAR